jgi:hypothetical protein
VKITTDPTDPDFREALRKIGAPEWYPQEAPIHKIELEQLNEYTTRLWCPECGWEKLYNGKRLQTTKEGDKWALHMGGSIQITGVEVTQKDYLEPFEEFFGEA